MTELETLEHGSGASEKQSTNGSYTDEKQPIDSASTIHGDFSTLDVGLKLAAGHENDPDVSPLESARLRRKLDWHLLPLLCLIYTGECLHLPVFLALELINRFYVCLVQFIDKYVTVLSSLPPPGSAPELALVKRLKTYRRVDECRVRSCSTLLCTLSMIVSSFKATASKKLASLSRGSPYKRFLNLDR